MQLENIIYVMSENRVSTKQKKSLIYKNQTLNFLG